MLHCFAAPLLGLFAIHPVQAVGGCSTPSFAEASGSPHSSSVIIRAPSVAIADFDLDGRPDLAIEDDLFLTVALGDGLGGFDFQPFLPSRWAVNGSRDIATADFNRDGTPDIAVASNSLVSILLVNGRSGGLSQVDEISPEASLLSIAAGDLNRDGASDLVVATASVNVYLGGDGTCPFPEPDGTCPFPETCWFPEPSESLVVSGVGTPSHVAIADLDLDGRPDLLVSCFADDEVFVLRGDGSGEFQADVPPLEVPGVASAAVGDLDLDGKPDLVLVSPTGPLQVRLGDGEGGFPNVDALIDHVGEEAAIGDFNQDGKPDIAIGSKSGIVIRLGDGTGGFPETHASVEHPTDRARAVAAGDFDRDGRLDLVSTFDVLGSQGIPDDGGVFVLMNTCDELPCPGANFAPFEGSPFAAPSATRAVETADFDRDGDLDLALPDNGDEGGVTIRFGDGQGGFSASSFVSAGSRSRDLAVEDFDLDGVLDLAVANSGSNSVTIHLGDGSGGFPITSTISGPEPLSVATGDFDRDGMPDLVMLGAHYPRLTIRYGDGSGFFPQMGWDYELQMLPAPDDLFIGPIEATVGDLDLDGQLDLVVTHGELGRGRDFEVLFGNVGFGGPFERGPRIRGLWSPISSAIADLNLDGTPDLAVSENARVWVALNIGARAFSQPVAYGQRLMSSYGLAIADLDLDGFPDIVAPNADDDSITVRRGDGTGTFPDMRSSSVPAGDGPVAVAATDFDHDGKPDLAIVNELSGEVTVLRNTCAANAAPLADAGADQTVECAGGTTEVALDGSGSSDPDEDALGYSWREGDSEIATGASPTVSLSTGAHVLTLTVTDPNGETSSDEVTVVVEDSTAPVIHLTTGAIRLRPPNHRYVDFHVAAFASGASDGCDSAIDASDVVIASVSSDEPEDTTGTGDGNTLQDILIAPGCRSVRLRAERAELGNGRVYTVTLAVRDTVGNVGTAIRQVRVPVFPDGPTTDDGAAAGYTVDGCDP